MPDPSTLAAEHFDQPTIMQITDGMVESATRAWWNAPGPDGQRMATVAWDDYTGPGKEQYRARCRHALLAALDAFSRHDDHG